MDSAEYAICVVDDTGEFGIDYLYRVRAHDAAGNTSPWVGLAEASQLDNVAPAPPTNLAVENRPGEADITWTLSTSTDVVEYVIEATASGYDGVVETVDATTGTVTLTLNPQPTYTVRVTAVDKAGNTASTTGTANVYDTDLLPPENLTALGQEDAGIRVEWDHSPSDTTGKAYRLYRNGTFLTTLTGTLYQDTSVDHGVDYGYMIETVDGFSRTSARIGPAIATPGDTTPPAPPTDLTFTTDIDEFTVTISPSPSTDVTDYRIRVFRTDSGSTVGERTIPAGGSLQSRFTGLTGGDTYTVTVTAIDRGLNESSGRSENVTPEQGCPFPPCN